MSAWHEMVSCANIGKCMCKRLTVELSRSWHTTLTEKFEFMDRGRKSSLNTVRLC